MCTSRSCEGSCPECRQVNNTATGTGRTVATVSWIDDARRTLRTLEANPLPKDRERRARLREQIAEYEDAAHARAEHEMGA